jgi:hypothetical protein
MSRAVPIACAAALLTAVAQGSDLHVSERLQEWAAARLAQRAERDFTG